MTAFMLNGRTQEVAVNGDTPLLWVLREHLKLTGTKSWSTWTAIFAAAAPI